MEIEPRKVTQTIGPPALVLDVENFHLSLGLSEVLIDAVYHDVGELFPSPNATALNLLPPALFADATVFLRPLVFGTIQVFPSCCAGDEAFGGPGLVSLTTVQPEAFVDADVERCYDASSTMIVFPAAVGHADFICSSSVLAGPVAMAPALPDLDDVVAGSNIDTSYALTGYLVVDDEVAAAPVVDLMIRYLMPLPHVDVEDTLDPDGVAALGHLLPELGVMDADVVIPTAVTPGAASLAPIIVDATDVGFPADLQASVGLSPALALDGDQSHDAVALPGDASLGDPDTAHDDGFAGSSLVAGPVAMQSDWFGDTDMLLAASAVVGPANLGPYPYEVIDVIMAPAFEQTSILTPARFRDVDHLFPARLSGGHYHSSQGARLGGSMSGPAYMVGGVKQHSLTGSIETSI